MLLAQKTSVHVCSASDLQMIEFFSDPNILLSVLLAAVVVVVLRTWAEHMSLMVILSKSRAFLCSSTI